MQRAREELEEFKGEFAARTRHELEEHAKHIADVPAAYLHDWFFKEGGKGYNMTQMSKACEIFDPFFLKDASMEELESRAELLVHFDYRHFEEGFIDELKNKLRHAKEHTLRPYNFDRLKDTRQYQTRIDRAIKRRKLNNDHEFDWKKDPGERASKIWLWWKERLFQLEFRQIRLALILVVLAQVSSCAVERVFSQLNLVRQKMGDNLSEEMTECYMLARCNGDLNIFVE